MQSNSHVSGPSTLGCIPTITTELSRSRREGCTSVHDKESSPQVWSSHEDPSISSIQSVLIEWSSTVLPLPDLSRDWKILVREVTLAYQDDAFQMMPLVDDPQRETS